MKTMRIMIYCVLTISSLIGMEAAGAASARKPKTETVTVHNILRIELNKHHVIHYQAKFDPFVKRRKWQAKAISSWVGGIAASLFSDVNIDEARAFLGRTFEDEDALKQAAQKLHTDEDSITYLKTLLNNMKSDDIRKKNATPLALLMKEHKHPALQKIEAKPWDREKVDNDTFYRIAACNFMAYVIVEEGAQITEEGTL